MLRLDGACPCSNAQYNVVVSVMMCQSLAKVSVSLGFCYLFVFGPRNKGKRSQPETINTPDVQLVLTDCRYTANSNELTSVRAAFS